MDSFAQAVKSILPKERKLPQWLPDEYVHVLVNERMLKPMQRGHPLCNALNDCFATIHRLKMLNFKQRLTLLSALPQAMFNHLSCRFCAH
jgi:hypothetical protein